MSGENNPNNMTMFMIGVGVLLILVLFVAVATNVTQSNYHSDSPSYNNNYTPPTPTPTPTPKPAMFRIYNLDAVASSTGLINVNYKTTISAAVTNYGETAGFVHLKGYVKQNDTTKEQTRSLYLTAGETQYVQFSFERLQGGSYQYNIIQM
jgi:hypothetical protein